MASSNKPWNQWTPGVLSKGQVEELVKGEHLQVADSGAEISVGIASVDLTLSNEIWHLPDGAIKPTEGVYRKEIKKFSKSHTSSEDGSWNLQPGETYVIKLRERLTGLEGSGIFGQATAKSSVGRVDVLARLIADGMDCYETFSSAKKPDADLFLELTPLTFPVKIKQGISLSQLRLFYGNPEDSRVKGEEGCRNFLIKSKTNDGTLRLDLSPAEIDGKKIVAFKALDSNGSFEAIPLWKEQNRPGPDPRNYWELVEESDSKRLSLKRGSFYILRSKELLALPKGVAVYCRANDESFGEMRIHYAGFAHPLFGRRREDGTIGTPLIFEVRGHDVNVTLQDDEAMARLLFYRMSEDASEKDSDGSYEGQQLQLSKFFGPWSQQNKGVGKKSLVTTEPTRGRNERKRKTLPKNL